ncbi:hypothetical protein BGZ70_010256 [Mortierella alpina]|uniref:Uncharacterized protein n=1 Tax=Mortierella alpina TaxID=64518 RepID=A0A9P6LZU3_MORAP|nr:hypothetical protein BGZ70_010256 [Mortierella alpina]
MVAIRDVVFAVTSAAGLLGLFASFMGVKVDNPPHQHISPITGFPTWHQEYKNEVKEITVSFTVLALIFSVVAAYAGHRATRSPSRSLTGFVTISTGNEESSTQINEFIQWYIDATLVAVVGYLFFDVGKLWAVVGALHNQLEVALLIILHSGGRVSSMSFGLYMFAYVCATIMLSVYLQWPLDAIFFRWQGLCSDFGLIVMFVRMYMATKKQLDSFGNRDRHDAQLATAQEEADRLSHEQHHASSSSSSRHTSPGGPASPLPTTVQSHHSHSPLHHLQSGWKKFVALAPTLNSENDSIPGTPNGNHAAQAISHPSPGNRFAGEPAQTIVTLNTTTSNGSNAGISKVSIVALNQDESIWGVQWRNPDQIGLLIAAAIFHVLGNCMTTIWATSIYAMAAFHVSYGLSFPLYAYYLYVDNHALRQTKVYMPEFSKIKTFTSACLSLMGATITVRLGLYVATKAASQAMDAL